MISYRFVLALCCIGTLTSSALAQEICDNAIDDDGNGLTDLNDTTGCACNAVIGGNGVSSILPNSSFEDYDCLPTTYSQLDCADTWAQATWSTSDYFYTGSYMPSFIQQPLPGGGNGCVGGYICPDYMEYIGGCLLQPMVTGTSYSLSMSMAAVLVDNMLQNTTPMNLSPVDITIWGYNACPSWPVNASLCPEPEGWTALGTVSYTPDNAWSPVTITFTPTYDVQAIMIGSPCVPPADYPSVSSSWLAYFLYDNLTLNESSLFGTTITDSGDFYTNDETLTGHPDTAATHYQWYYQGVALVGETDTVLSIATTNPLDTGWYQFLSSFDTACTIAEMYVPLPICVPAIIANPITSQCTPLNMQFQNGSDTTQVISMQWDFGDGSDSSTAYEPSHLYTVPGTYNVTLQLISDDHCPTDTTFTGLVVVNQFPEASFTADPLEGCIGMNVQFTNTTDTLTGTCAWDFGDGTPVSNICDAQHVFANAGIFDVRLTVTSASGCVDDTLMTSYITVYAHPSVSFTADTLNGCTPLAIQFTNTTPQNQVGTVLWDFGNGATSTDLAPTYVYDTPGIYDVNLLVTHPLGCQGDTTYAHLITAYGHPVVSFTAAPDSGCYPLEVTFTNNTDPTMLGTCLWTFGDGQISDNCAPLNTYALTGHYDVGLQVISPHLCEGDTAYPNLITVFDHPTAAFFFEPQPTDYFNTYITFLDSSSVDAIQWEWTFGQDGALGTSTEEFPNLHFPDSDMGTYPVRLVVTNSNTCTDTMWATVEINGYFSVYAPNAFTPDGDGINEYFMPLIMDQREKFYRLSIYDRWGGKVFDSSDPKNVWIGTEMNFGGQVLPTGVYVWHLQTSSAIDGIGKEFLGHVTLLH